MAKCCTDLQIEFLEHAHVHSPPKEMTPQAHTLISKRNGTTCTYTHLQKKWHHRHKGVGGPREAGEVSDAVKAQRVVPSCGEQPVETNQCTHQQTL